MDFDLASEPAITAVDDLMDEVLILKDNGATDGCGIFFGRTLSDDVEVTHDGRTQCEMRLWRSFDCHCTHDDRGVDSVTVEDSCCREKVSERLVLFVRYHDVQTFQNSAAL